MRMETNVSDTPVVGAPLPPYEPPPGIPVLDDLTYHQIVETMNVIRPLLVECRARGAIWSIMGSAGYELHQRSQWGAHVTVPDIDIAVSGFNFYESEAVLWLGARKLIVVQQDHITGAGGQSMEADEQVEKGEYVTFLVRIPAGLVKVEWMNLSCFGGHLREVGRTVIANALAEEMVIADDDAEITRIAPLSDILLLKAVLGRDKDATKLLEMLSQGHGLNLELAFRVLVKAAAHSGLVAHWFATRVLAYSHYFLGELALNHPG